MSTFVEVSRDQFFKHIGPQDVTLDCQPDITNWRIRSTKQIVAQTPGYKHCETTGGTWFKIATKKTF